MTDPLTPMLQSCSLHALLMCVSKTLTRSGFGDAVILDRRSSRQKSRDKGHELLCEGAFGCLPVKVIVKVVRDQIRTRMVDELAGTVLRTNSDIGILISPFNRSRSVVALQGAHRPVRLEFFDGDRLANVMRCSGVGVRSKGEVDYAFFSELEEVSERILAFLRKGAV